MIQTVFQDSKTGLLYSLRIQECFDLEVMYKYMKRTNR